MFLGDEIGCGQTRGSDKEKIIIAKHLTFFTVQTILMFFCSVVLLYILQVLRDCPSSRSKSVSLSVWPSAEAISQIRNICLISNVHRSTVQWIYQHSRRDIHFSKPKEPLRVRKLFYFFVEQDSRYLAEHL